MREGGRGRGSNETFPNVIECVLGKKPGDYLLLETFQHTLGNSMLLETCFLQHVVPNVVQCMAG